ncbi:MAG: class I SAM-dependent methyltransferase [Pirellulaceae bacterium]|nr:class I SAM-dependent methyltransferase [Pirellulaceae bacterium]
MPHVCPWWGGFFIDNRLRRWLHPPERILEPYLRPGMTILDFGCGMGFFSIAAAGQMGDSGRVVAVDLQQQMLDVLRKRADRAAVGSRIRTHRCEADALNLEEAFDFALAFYSAHEVPDQRRLLREIHGLLREGAKFLLVEPIGHVTAKAFARTLDDAVDLGWSVVDRPRIRWSHAAVLEK